MFNRNSKISLFTAVLLVSAILISALPLYSAATDATESNPPVLLSSDTESSVIDDTFITAGKDDSCYNITWTSTYEGDEYVQWVESEKITDSLFPTDCYSDDAVKENGTARAEITSLESETEYSYRVGNDSEGWSEVYSFSTGKFDDSSFSFILVGDPQVGDAAFGADGVDWMNSMKKVESWFGDEAEFLMIAGDMVTNPDGNSEFPVFSAPEQLRSLPMITTVGNHDNGVVYSKHFTYTDVDQTSLSKAGTYGGDYWVEYDGALIMSLNTNTESIAIHRNFMEKAIAEFTELHGEPTWKLVLFHHSQYSAAQDRDTLPVNTRVDYSAVFSMLGIDAVMMGHDHIYTRTYMMDGTNPIDDPARYTQVGEDKFGSYADPKETEVFYLTANAAGDKHYGLSSNQHPYAAFKNQEFIPNITKVDVTPDSLSFVTYRSAETSEITDIVDSFTIYRTGSDEPLCSSVEAVNSDTSWKYLDDGNYPFDLNGDQLVWTLDSFDDSTWKEAAGPFGTINDELADHDGVTPETLINLCYPEGSDEEGANIPNHFFRTSFDLDDPDNVEEIIAKLWYDDSVNVYINGIKIQDLHVGNVGNVGYSANDRGDYRTYGYFKIWDKDLIASLNLKETGNILAVELYQSWPDSEDLFFDFTSLTFEGELTLPFTDVKTTSWYYNNVAKAYSMGLFAGVTETTFEPKSTMTRAMVWTVLAKMEDVDLSGGEKWYSKAQEWAMANGVSDGTYPSNNISREQLATMLYSMSGKPAVEGNLNGFTDKDSASAWAVDALVWAVENELMVGRGEGILAPRADLTRAEACTLILKYLDIR